jgi:hypothetical protein
MLNEEKTIHIKTLSMNCEKLKRILYELEN